MSRNDFRRRQAQRQRRKLVRHLPIILALFLAFSALAAGVFALTRFVLNRQPISSASASSSTAKTTSEDPAQPISSPASGTLAQAAYIAAGYDYDRAIALIKEDSSLAEDPAALEAITSYEEAKASLLPADVQNVPHVFFHSLIMDTAKAFDGDSRTPGYNSVMTTKDEFLKITQTQNHYFTDMAGKRSFNCYNHNAFLTMMEGVLSGKTGFTGGAGYSYVGAMENQGRTYVIALLGCGWPPHKTYKWSDARKLYTYGLEHFKMKDVFQEETFARVPVSGGLCWKEGEGAIDQVELSMMLNPDDMHLTLLMGEGEEARVVKKVPSILMAPVREGQQVGTVDYYLGEVLVKRFPVYAMQGVEKMNLRRAADRVLALFLVR